MGSKIVEKFVEILNKFAEKVNNLKYIIAIKNTFAALLPVIITGAFATLFSSVLFNVDTGLAQIDALSFLAEFKPIADVISYFTMNFLTIYVVFLLGFEVAKLNKLKGIFPGIVALMSYLVMNPSFINFVTDDGASIQITNVLGRQYTNTEGLFLGMFAAILSIELYTWFGKQDRLKIKMPDSVPETVSTSFSALVPTILIVTVMATFGFAIEAITGMYASDIIYSLVQQPLQGLIQGLPGILLLMLVAQIFWVIGLHGMQMVRPIREPLLLAAIVANTTAFQAGEQIPNIVNMPFWDVFMTFGGSGGTLGLLIAIFLVSKRDDYRQIAKLSFVPGLFNINEPLIYGLPIMLNPILAIPFIITPLITGTIGYFAISVGFAARSVVMVPWPVPAIINAYISTAGDIGAVITQIFCIIVAVLIYLPFVKVANRTVVSEVEAMD
ncbi:PTS sugar transporter subunit IIC [Alkalibacterium olivapovliticus]|uniref:Permease IIC component n=1 Tax=Alkalibacterium olivapovliticus TaxID=99907 RepID=A0A2T0VWD6_9LACT|nr:PTS transporter subunit EIIC [Alkalibacterium olivapovliticus]PRY76185.1 PTS system cellobiose-specific IIC component [Alkalibacterium olivapovliticus]